MAMLGDIDDNPVPPASSTQQDASVSVASTPPCSLPATGTESRTVVRRPLLRRRSTLPFLLLASPQQRGSRSHWAAATTPLQPPAVMGDRISTRSPYSSLGRGCLLATWRRRQRPPNRAGTVHPAAIACEARRAKHTDLTSEHKKQSSHFGPATATYHPVTVPLPSHAALWPPSCRTADVRRRPSIRSAHHPPISENSGTARRTPLSSLPHQACTPPAWGLMRPCLQPVLDGVPVPELFSFLQTPDYFSKMLPALTTIHPGSLRPPSVLCVFPVGRFVPTLIVDPRNSALAFVAPGTPQK
ncbi:hypothetical protein BDV95DRAFT_648837 [Massariosphaeria phaeospora]|uniref:Uncharacterized protein n=1 Tax=Massariosphaeria phaeospora TaxID=100035 RepID=A0A7C8M2U4_9PLEO|nr:hypothetical protein BDV95DRAFT_648837 [Massariosphaeria phaeospora]